MEAYLYIIYMPNQTFDIYVYDFESNTLLDNFNYKLYKRDSTISYRQGEKQIPPWDCGLWPNNPVNINHDLIDDMTNVTSPHTLTLTDNETYYIIIWKDCYETKELQFYIANDYFGDMNDLYFTLRPMDSMGNERIFV